MGYYPQLWKEDRVPTPARHSSLIEAAKQHNATASPILNLPTEVFEKIISHTFESDYPIFESALDWRFRHAARELRTICKSFDQAFLSQFFLNRTSFVTYEAEVQLVEDPKTEQMVNIMLGVDRRSIYHPDHPVYLAHGRVIDITINAETMEEVKPAVAKAREFLEKMCKVCLVRLYFSVEANATSFKHEIRRQCNEFRWPKLPSHGPRYSRKEHPELYEALMVESVWMVWSLGASRNERIEVEVEEEVDEPAEESAEKVDDELDTVEDHGLEDEEDEEADTE